MLTDFKRDLELMDGVEYDHLKMLYYDLGPSFSDEYKSYEYSRFCTILEGSKHITVNNNITFTYEPGQFVLLPPHSHVHMDIDVPTRCLVFELSNSLMRNVIEKISIELETDNDTLSENRFFVGNINDELGNCLNKLTNVSAKPEKNKEFLVDLYAQEMVYNLVRFKGIQQIINMECKNPLNQAVRYIHERIKEPISICQLAHDLNMSEANFCQSFKKTMGITPKEYVTSLKLTKAKSLLRNQNVTEVAYDLGYENISHFITLFRNKYGVTPKQYQSTSKVSVAND